MEQHIITVSVCFISPRHMLSLRMLPIILLMYCDVSYSLHVCVCWTYPTETAELIKMTLELRMRQLWTLV